MEGALKLRYLFLMMGFFAMFTGLLYNEFFAISLQIFGKSCYQDEVQVIGGTGTSPIFGYPRRLDAFTNKLSNDSSGLDQQPNCVYPVGFDPVWFLSDQLLSFSNNFKMKLAVIFAIIQMSLGILMKGLNSIHFRNKLDFLFEFLPAILILLALFGWMDVLIIAKWLQPKNIEGVYMPNTLTTNKLEVDKFNEIHLSPAIISTMIDIFLNGASNANKTMQDPKLENNSGIEYLYVVGGQKIISTILLLLVLVCVPIMLFAKPLILKKQLEHHHKEEAGLHVEVQSEKIQYQMVGGKQSMISGNE